MNSHETYILRTLELAARAVERGNHPFGALLVRNGEIILEAENTVCDLNDVTAHAELELVRRGSRELGEKILSECTLYTSTEPCPMCAGAIFWAGIPRLVFCVSAQWLLNHTNYGMKFCSRALYGDSTREIEVIGPLLEEQGMKLHQDFW